MAHTMTQHPKVIVCTAVGVNFAMCKFERRSSRRFDTATEEIEF